MRICKSCGGHCDEGEIVGHICLECMEEERQRQIKSETVVRIMNSPFEQMELDWRVINA